MLDNRYATQLLQDRIGIFSEIATEKDLGKMISHYGIMALIFSAVYGLFMGFFAGGMQIFSVMIKVPILLFGTLAICIPSLFTFNVILGSKLSFKQTLAVSIMSTYLLSLILVSLSPIMLLFNISSDNRSFIVLLNVVFFSISGLFGMSLLWHSMKYLSMRHLHNRDLEPSATLVVEKSNSKIIKIWTLIYIFVGTQMAWLLRPFVGIPGDFAWLREIGGNIYTAIGRNILDVLF